MSSIKSRMILAFGLFGTLLVGTQTVMAASAPPLSEVKVLKVQSTSCGIENIAPGQEKTQCDHAGPNIKIYVLEIGYGRLPNATLDGFQVNGVRTPVCAYANGNLTECSGMASKIVGNVYTFDLAGKQEGTFTFSNTSINAPGNTMSTQLYIK
ncbi:YolA family protein [Pseudomonas sp. 6D_7.1_Bac1]|uniref:YolA family protein n=1 Tax=Pseudomonas sp. 6D_7.1_Bac1 TaxID=2971615 RepID=UPI0021C86618|nr:YolA family protein [Pseudomonas sp. 6D_7.1_Bac1]MCU1750940.1 YolA family protein [Pseudomonas sp. 6D_7.1_Bac1]